VHFCGEGFIVFCENDYNLWLADRPVTVAVHM